MGGLDQKNAIAQHGEPLPAEVEETSVDQFTFHLNPFSCAMVKGVQVL